jgi:sarcosine oxidase, subunit gamma
LILKGSVYVPDHRLKPLTALGHPTPQTDTIGPVTITENAALALASLATRNGRDADVAKAAKALNITLPPPGRASENSLWLSPNQWMCDAGFDTHEDIVAYLKPAFGDAASITEQTDAWVRFDLTGPNLHAMFELLCNLDTRAMRPGHATRTVIEHLGCYVTCTDAGFSILGPRSSAKSLHHALITAAKSAF